MNLLVTVVGQDRIKCDRDSDFFLILIIYSCQFQSDREYEVTDSEDGEPMIYSHLLFTCFYIVLTQLFSRLAYPVFTFLI